MVKSLINFEIKFLITILSIGINYYCKQNIEQLINTTIINNFSLIRNYNNFNYNNFNMINLGDIINLGIVFFY